MNRKLFFQILTLFGLGALLGWGSNALRGPDRGGIPWVTDWSESIESKADTLGLQLAGLDEVDQWARDGSRIFLDARSPEDYSAGHIPGAMSLPFHHLDTYFPDVQLFLTPDQPVVCYCSGEDCEDSLLLGEFLVQQGYTNVFLFEGGMNAWRAAGRMENSQ